MADIRRYGLTRHLRSTPTMHVVHLRRGKVAHEGVGIAFMFRALNAAISEVPTAENELPVVFHARTSDFQDVTLQVTVTYRFDQPGVAARRLDFGIDPYTGVWLSDPMNKVAARITELAQQYAIEHVATSGLVDLLAHGLPAVREAMVDGLATDERLAETSIVVIGVRVVSIRPVADLEKALETPLRERVQQDADKATYERRALAVERERAIAENELQSKIELATREELLVKQEGANAQKRAHETAASDRITVTAQVEFDGIRSEAAITRERAESVARAETTRVLGAANAEAETARLASYAGVDPAVLLALAAQSAATNLPQIGSLSITPDAITDALARLSGRTPPASPAG
jgi:regulator of protease activity HflC (stomatin/prohibitin superfamily)